MNLTDAGSPLLNVVGTNSDETVLAFFGNSVVRALDGNDTINGSNEKDALYGNNGNDTINGYNGNDYLYGGSGNDYLYGGNGNDELNGGTGNDVLYGGKNDDTYVFELGSGNDTIDEQGYGGTDKVVFGEGITPDDIVVTRDESDMVLLVGNGGDSLRLKLQYSDYYNIIESFEFADGTVRTADDYFAETVTMNISGEYSDPDDYATGNTIIIGSDETDIVKGNGRIDIIHGGGGDDILYGGNGNDELNGGTGNDVLYGGKNDDTYVFELGSGNDTIDEQGYGGTDKVVFGEGITPDDIVVTRDESDMVLLVGNNGDSLRLKLQYSDYSNIIESFEFADGTIAHVDINTSELVIDVEGTSFTLEHTLAEFLCNMYSDNMLSGEPSIDNIIISEVTESTTVGDETDEIADQTDIQVMILTENMSAFADEDNVFDNTDVLDSTDDMSMMNQLLVGSNVQ